jgi:hypothetical protein
MKKLIWLCICIGLLTAPRTSASAQGCFTFSNNYGTYNSIDSDGDNIYTSVTVDGSGSMTITGGQGCSGINYSNAQHIPQALNIIVAPGGSYVGGQQSGPGECPNCYLSTTNYQSMAASSSGNYTFNWNGAVYCTMGGGVFGSGGSSLLAIHHAAYKFDHMIGTSHCAYYQQCPNGNAAALCGEGVIYAHSAQACAFPWMIDRRLSENGKCTEIGKAYLSGSSVNCD